MSPRDLLLARAAELRCEARRTTGLLRARMLSRAEQIERRLLGDARLTGESFTSARIDRAGLHIDTITAGPTLSAWAGKGN